MNSLSSRSGGDNLFSEWCNSWKIKNAVEILDFWHALEHAWELARLHYGEGSKQADLWVHHIAEDLRAGKVHQVMARFEPLRPKTTEVQKCLHSLIRYHSSNAARMRYDEYLRLG